MELTEAQYAQLSNLIHPSGGDLKWQWNGVTFNALADVRKTVRITTSPIIASGTSLSITLSVLKADGTVDAAFNGQVTINATVGNQERAFRVTFVNGIKTFNVPTTNIFGLIRLYSSANSLIETDSPTVIVQDV